LTQDINELKNPSTECTRPVFDEYFLAKRLRRVPFEFLKNFMQNFQEVSHVRSQIDMVDKIVTHYQIMSENKSFIEKFNDFTRDYVFSAKESEYILQLQNKELLFDWISSWSSNIFQGQNFNFSLHIRSYLNEKLLSFDADKIYLPTEVILLFASSKEPKHIASGSGKGGAKMVEYFPITEFEIILRKDSTLIEVRGDYKVIRDFVNTAILDSDNPLSMAQSIFVGDYTTDSNLKPLVKSVQVVKIDTLKTKLQGSYKSMSAPVNGNKTSRVKVSLDSLNSADEETDPFFKTLLEDYLINGQDKSDICFVYKEKEYSFCITKFGGLYFQKYAPEEVISYVLSKIGNIISIVVGAN
jgi:hypothetical protein